MSLPGPAGCKGAEQVGLLTAFIVQHWVEFPVEMTALNTIYSSSLRARKSQVKVCA